GLNQPTASPPPPLENQIVSSPFSEKARWCVPKQVLISVIFCVFGSYIATWRPEVLIGVTLADGWSEPSWQKAGVCAGRMGVVIHTRPLASIIGLCITVWLSQIFSSPK